MLLIRPYSEDLRKKIVAAVERGMPKTEATRAFGVSLSSAKRYRRLAAQVGQPEVEASMRAPELLRRTP